MSEEKKIVAEVSLMDKAIVEQASLIINSEANRKKQWGVDEHVAFIKNMLYEIGIITEDTPKQAETNLRYVLECKGIGGNASQFRQHLQNKLKLIPKSAEQMVNSDDWKY